MKCSQCCEAEYRACSCIMNCGIFQDRCDGINKARCDILRDCYVRIDDESPKGYDFEWQCDLMKCISFCLRDVEICAPIQLKFQNDHCLKAKELDLDQCDVNCAGA